MPSGSADINVLMFPVRQVFALVVREHNGTLVCRIIGYDDEGEIPERHLPPLPDVAEKDTAPYRLSVR